MERRELLRLAAAAGAGLAAAQVADALPAAIPVIDTHIHLFDTGRPGGVPWPPVDDKSLYKPALPDRYKKIAAGFGVVGAIVIEASPLASDNDWVLRVAADHPIIVGMIGDLIPGTPGYQEDLERLHKNPLFLGIRYGNLWDRDLGVDAKKPEFLAGLNTLAERGLVLDSAPCFVTGNRRGCGPRARVTDRGRSSAQCRCAVRTCGSERVLGDGSPFGRKQERLRKTF